MYHFVDGLSQGEAAELVGRSRVTVPLAVLDAIKAVKSGSWPADVERLERTCTKPRKDGG